MPFESDPNGIKLSSNTLLYQNVTGVSTWFCEEWVRLGPTFHGPRLDSPRSVGIDYQRGQGFPGTRRAEPAQGIHEAAPLQSHALPMRRCQHDHADQGVDEGKDGQLLQAPDEAL